VLACLLDLPWHLLSPSVRVDVLGVLACDKPAIRFRLPHAKARNAVAPIIAAANWSSVDDGAYLVAARDSRLARQILAVDRTPEPHVPELGLLLGYPPCCVAAAAQAGEANIDSHANRIGAQCDLQKVWMLDPRGYTKGVALVSFIACSPRCVVAQHEALTAQSFVKSHVTHARRGREPWATWRATLQTMAGTGAMSECDGQTGFGS